ncbi:hypothetical protein [Phenylobacterium sp.]|uniref:hypothetical protein n=1 Tax=Phenylobacterium sp. TaxID=1871053 RepID=UPI00286D8353|nr:hypothetical protein [Phenylobacterium sp.]
MPNVAQLRRPRAVSSEPLFLFDVRRPVEAANADMIAKVISHADIALRQAGGRMKLRVSEEMVERLQIQGRLATGDHRLADLTVVWDEAEGEVVSVRDDARLRDANARFAEWDSLWDEASYEFADERRSVAA